MAQLTTLFIPALASRQVPFQSARLQLANSALLRSGAAKVLEERRVAPELLRVAVYA